MMSIAVIAIMACLFLAPSAVACTPSEYESYRSAISQSEELEGRRLLRLAYIGNALDGKWAVFDSLSVVEGMAAPRGERQLIVARLDDFQVSFALNLPIEESALTVPLWCHGDRIYLHGRTSGIPRMTGGAQYNGNCLRLIEDGGDMRFELLDVHAYGSSGGISDEVPGQEQRDQELRDWDEK